jgi:hypothetical protein
VAKRLRRIAAQGARLQPSGKSRAKRFTLRSAVAGTVFVLVLVPLVALMVYLLACVMVAVFLFALISAVMFMGLAMALIYRLLG